MRGEGGEMGDAVRGGEMGDGVPGGADFLQLDPAGAPGRGLTAWLAGEIRAAIIDGRLAAGTALPATRLLAGDLGISRGVVVEADQRLAGGGLVHGGGGGGGRRLRCCRSGGGRRPSSTCRSACPTCRGSRGRRGCGPSGRCCRRPAWPTSATAIRAAARRCAGNWRGGWAETP